MTTTTGTAVSGGPPVLRRSAGLLYTLGPDHAPILSVSPGERVRIETELNIGDVLHTDDAVFSAEMLRPPYVNPATGPIEIRGATAEHVCICTIEGIEVQSPGVTALVPRNTPFPDWLREREWGVHANVVSIRDGFIEWPGGLRLPVEPMVGVIGTAPLLDSLSTVDNGPHGGNLDVQEITVGARVTMPVAVDGALFALGDCHARQGDGELCGLGAIECRTTTTVTLDIAPRPPELRWPRIENATHICAVACARPLEDAFRLAVREIVAWMVADYGFTPEGALMLLGQVAEARATQIVNPKFTYIVKIAKRWLTESQ